MIDADHHLPAIGIAQDLHGHWLTVCKSLLDDLISMVEGEADEIDARDRLT